MIEPTVGRVVHFFPKGHRPGDHPWPALIAHVWSNTCVNLAIFDANGVPYPQPPTSITLLQDGAETPADGPYCAWMPFQKQAAKTEAVEQQLAESKA